MRNTEAPETMPPTKTKSTPAAPSRRRTPLLFGCILLSLLCGWSAIGNFLSFGDRSEHDRPSYPVAAQRSPSSDNVTTTRDIEDVRVGQRVLTGKEGEESSPTAVNPATWRLLTRHSQAKWADGTIDDVHVQTLQTPEWIVEHKARLGAIVPIPLDLVEMGVPEEMTAEVVADEPCPQIESSLGRVVLTTVNHLNRDVHTLTVADTACKVDARLLDTGGVTGFHKFYSLDRAAWVSCRDLHDNEQIRGFPDRTLTVVARSPLSGTHRVYNMTVETEHVYHVGELGVLAHNNGCASNPGDLVPDVPTRYGPAAQSDLPEALVAREAVEGGAPMYRIGTLDQSEAAEAQFWALEPPTSPTYPARYGIHPENVANADFVEVRHLDPGTPFVTRLAPSVGPNPGGGIEVVVPESGVRLDFFSAGGTGGVW